MRGNGASVLKAWVFGLVGSCLLLAACGGGGGNASSAPALPGPPVTGGSATATIVNFADSPSDRVVAFDLNIDSIKLTRSDNTVLSVLSTSRRVEVTHVSGSAAVLGIPSVPEGTYTMATIAVSAPHVVYIDNSGNRMEKRDTAATKTWNLSFSPALQVGTTPVVLTMDVDVRSSVSIDAVSGSVTINPVATMMRSNIAPAQSQQEVETGELEHTIGQVTATSANAFTMNAGAGAVSLTFSTDASTTFEGVSGAASLPLNTIVRVEGQTQPDGTLLAKEVEVVSANGVEGEGVVTSTTGNPASGFDMVVQDANGGGVTSSSFGSVMKVFISSRTKFKVEDGNIELSGLSLPGFSVGNLSKGQRVEAESDSPPLNGAITADTIKLQQQAIVGAASSITSSQFTLTIPDDSALRLLTGRNTLKVYMQRNTRFLNGATVTQGAIVKVRGLLFFDSAQGAFVIVAGRITTP